MATGINYLLISGFEYPPTPRKGFRVCVTMFQVGPADCSLKYELDPTKDKKIEIAFFETLQ